MMRVLSAESGVASPAVALNIIRPIATAWMSSGQFSISVRRD